MVTCNKLSLNILVLSVIFFLSHSCRVTPEDEKVEYENFSSSDLVSVGINVLGYEWEKIDSDISRDIQLPQNQLVAGGGVIYLLPMNYSQKYKP